MVNNVDRRSVQRSNYTPAKQTYVVNNEDIFDSEYDDVWPTRKPTSTRRYQSDVNIDLGRTQGDVQSPAYSNYPTTRTGRRSSVPARSTATQASMPAAQSSRRRTTHIDTDDIVSRSSGDLVTQGGQHEFRFHWLFFVGVAMLIMMAGWVMLSMLTNWWQLTQDDLHYGRPRTSQIDWVVDHNDSQANPSHFIALNLNRHVEIIEFPGGDASKAKVYIGPVLIGQGQDLAPVTLSFKDVNGDGKPDMIVNVQDSRFVFINENGAFRPPHPGENIHL